MCKKFLLAAVNARYIHSNPGVYSLRAFAKERLPEAEIQIAEYTINHQMDRILQDIYRKKPDFVGFSCYIWNISQVYELVRDLKQVLPETEIWLGGPEVSYDSGRILSQEPEIRGIMRGEGELTFSQVAEAYLAAEDRLVAEDPEDRLLARLEGILGITYRDGSGEIRENGPQRLLSMDEIPFYYKDMAGFENRIVYYESSRGCPFSCSYCLSSIDKSVRFRSLSLVKKELDFFLERKVPQVKFVDRTFNCRREHTLGIWKHILDHDNGVTNFHFEVSADLFDQGELEMIGRMRPGLIQLEIGVQSTNPDTIREIRRKMDLTKLEAAVDRVHGYRNTHQHLDLIAGLPWEGLDSFLQSFDDVYRMEPDQLQLGFFQIQLGLTHVIGKQGVALLDLLIHLHQNGVHRGGIILFHLRLILRRDHAGKAIHQTGGTQPADHGHRLYRGLALRIGAAARQRGQQHHGGQRNNSKFFHSVSPCNYFSSKRFLSIYV